MTKLTVFTDFFRGSLQEENALVFEGQHHAVLIPENPAMANMNVLLDDIYVRYIALNINEFQQHYKVFQKIFARLHKAMKAADNYYNHYSGEVTFAGSHYDRLRIVKPDEFDMDIIIRLPINLKADPINPANSDIVLEPKAPGFIQLKAGKQFQNLARGNGVDKLINKTAYGWMDERNYLLRSRFIDWFKSVVNKAMNRFANENGHSVMSVKGLLYTLRLSSSGPAITLIIENAGTGFRLDVDLVPALKFPEERWPICRPYRDIKKLRDSQGLNKIASYYIKTMFYHEAMDREYDSTFWRKSPAELFTIMVKKFVQCLEKGEILYFWNRENNLIGHIERQTLTGYAIKLKELIPILDDPSQYKLAAKFLLTDAEFVEHNLKYLHI